MLDDNGMGFSFGASAATAAELRRVACSFFVDCIINSVPIGRRKSAKKGKVSKVFVNFLSFWKV